MTCTFASFDELRDYFQKKSRLFGANFIVQNFHSFQKIEEVINDVPDRHKLTKLNSVFSRILFCRMKGKNRNAKLLRLLLLLFAPGMFQLQKKHF